MCYYRIPLLLFIIWMRMRMICVIRDGIRKFVARVIFLSAYFVSKIQCFIYECETMYQCVERNMGHLLFAKNGQRRKFSFFLVTMFDKRTTTTTWLFHKMIYRPYSSRLTSPSFAWMSFTNSHNQLYI